MKVGFNMLMWTTNVTEEDLPLLETLKPVGYDGVEIPLFEGQPAHFEKVGKAIKDNGLTCSSVTVIPDEEHNPVRADAANREGAAEHLKWAIDCSAALGSEVLCGPFYQPLGIFTGKALTEEKKQRAAEGMKFDLETYPTELVFDTPIKVSELAAYLGYEPVFMSIPKMAGNDHVYNDYSHSSISMNKDVTACSMDNRPNNARHPALFISYSHKDETWKERLVTHLAVLQKQSILNVWDDSCIGAGEDWYAEIEKALNSCSVAILMITPQFLSSNFILDEEMHRLLQRRRKEGLPVFPIIVKACPWKEVGWLSSMNVRPKNGRPIAGGTDHQIDTDFSTIAEEVASIIHQRREKGSNERLLLRISDEQLILRIHLSKFATEGNKITEEITNLIKALTKTCISHGGSGLGIDSKEKISEA